MQLLVCQMVLDLGYTCASKNLHEPCSCCVCGELRSSGMHTWSLKRAVWVVSRHALKVGQSASGTCASLNICVEKGAVELSSEPHMHNVVRWQTLG